MGTPLIGVTGCTHEIKAEGDGAYHIVGNKYVTSLTDGAGALVVMIPSVVDAQIGGRLKIAPLLGRLDGLLVTGSPSNVEPQRYGGGSPREGTRLDPDRDATTLPLIRAALDRGLPVFAICRGHQELNVALGGTLHTHIHELPEKLDHREPKSDDLDINYGPVHDVALTPGGVLQDIAGGVGPFPVNSLHSQGINRLADRLCVEAVSPDGVIEAVRVEDTKSFAIGVQWHPEYKVRENPLSLALFEAFGRAARAYSGL